MRSSIILPLLLVLPVTALANGFQGVFDLEGRYSTQRRTSAKLLVVQDSGGNTLVTRRAKYLGDSYANEPEFTWISDDVAIDAGGELIFEE